MNHVFENRARITNNILNMYSNSSDLIQKSEAKKDGEDTVEKAKDDDHETPGFQKLENEKVVTDNDEDNKKQDAEEKKKEEEVEKADVSVPDAAAMEKAQAVVELGVVGKDLEEQKIEKGQDVAKLAQPIQPTGLPYTFSANEIHNFRKNNIQNLYR